MFFSMLHASTPEGGSGLEKLRAQLFGGHFQEVEGRMKEQRVAMEGNLARNRHALMERVDELGAAFHRDLQILRHETNKELEDLKRDVFSAVMNLSVLNDKLDMAGSRSRETWMALAKVLTDRMDQQSISTQATILGFQQRLEATLTNKVAAADSSPISAPISALLPLSALPESLGTSSMHEFSPLFTP
jgi:hypothetical protein